MFYKHCLNLDRWKAQRFPCSSSDILVIIIKGLFKINLLFFSLLFVFQFGGCILFFNFILNLFY